jgi:tRNA modification GTPase
VLYFPSPNTVTGEDVLELHIHGGPATVKAVLSSIPQCSSQASHVRYAEPGEFTRRAFQNGRLDLAQVEALSDALSAETEQQRRAAVRGNASALGKQYEAWRQQLLGARGELEALIDFSEDHDFSDSDPDMLGNVYEAIKDIRQSIEVHDEAAKRGELLRKGIRISLLGPPNAGKSSLLNRIVGREASIVTPEAGTTRDVIEVSLDIGGYLCTFADTAGLRVAGQGKRSDEIGVVELEGIRRAKEKAKESDMIIVMTSVEKSPDMDEEWHINYDIESLELASNAGLDGEHCRALVVINKTDSIPPAQFEALQNQFSMFVSMLRHLPQPIAISCLETSAADTKDPGNINTLVSKLTDSFESLTVIPDALYGVTERQRQLLQRCDEHLAQYLRETGGKDVDMRNMDFDVVVAAEELREAADALGRLTGRGEASDVNEVLGVVFEKFCVGK